MHSERREIGMDETAIRLDTRSVGVRTGMKRDAAMSRGTKSAGGRVIIIIRRGGSVVANSGMRSVEAAMARMEGILVSIRI